MPIVTLDITSIVSATGWVNATLANLTTSNDVRATGGTAGEIIVAELADAPADFASLNSVQIHVEARTLGSVSRAKQLTIELLGGPTAILETFSTGDLNSADAVYSSSAFVRGDSIQTVGTYRLRATVTESGGMADSASVEIDRIWATIDYNAIAANLDFTLSGTDGADSLSGTIETPLELTMSGTDGADTMDATVTVETPSELIPKIIPPVVGMIFTTT